MERWSYRGLVCQLDKTDTGMIYTVYEVGLITRDIHVYMYGGCKDGFTRKDIEDKIDLKLREAHKHTVSVCPHLVESYHKGHCPFDSVCAESCPCIFEEVGKLLDEVNTLEEKLDDYCDYDSIKNDLDEAQGDISDLEDDVEELENVIKDIKSSLVDCNDEEYIERIEEILGDY